MEEKTKSSLKVNHQVTPDITQDHCLPTRELLASQNSLIVPVVFLSPKNLNEMWNT